MNKSQILIQKCLESSHLIEGGVPQVPNKVWDKVYPWFENQLKLRIKLNMEKFILKPLESLGLDDAKLLEIINKVKEAMPDVKGSLGTNKKVINLKTSDFKPWNLGTRFDSIVIEATTIAPEGRVPQGQVSTLSSDKIGELRLSLFLNMDVLESLTHSLMFKTQVSRLIDAIKDKPEDLFFAVRKYRTGFDKLQSRLASKLAEIQTGHRSTIEHELIHVLQRASGDRFGLGSNPPRHKKDGPLKGMLKRKGSTNSDGSTDYDAYFNDPLEYKAWISTLSDDILRSMRSSQAAGVKIDIGQEIKTTVRTQKFFSILQQRSQKRFNQAITDLTIAVQKQMRKEKLENYITKSQQLLALIG